MIALQHPTSATRPEFVRLLSITAREWGLAVPMTPGSCRVQKGREPRLPELKFKGAVLAGF